MTVFKCSVCGVNITKDLDREDKTEFSVNLDADKLSLANSFLETPIEGLWNKEGDFAVCEDDTFTAVGPYWDEEKSRKHGWDKRGKFHGCCGLNPSEGLNTVCPNNHKVGTKITECGLPNCIILDSDSVTVD